MHCKMEPTWPLKRQKYSSSPLSIPWTISVRPRNSLLGFYAYFYGTLNIYNLEVTWKWHFQTCLTPVLHCFLSICLSFSICQATTEHFWKITLWSCKQHGKVHKTQLLQFITKKVPFKRKHSRKELFSQ